MASCNYDETKENDFRNKANINEDINDDYPESLNPFRKKSTKEQEDDYPEEFNPFDKKHEDDYPEDLNPFNKNQEDDYPEYLNPFNKSSSETDENDPTQFSTKSERKIKWSLSESNVFKAKSKISSATALIVSKRNFSSSPGVLNAKEDLKPTSLDPKRHNASKKA